MLARNEAANLPRALASVPPGAPVLVVDAESTDGTVSVARAHGAETVVRPWPGFVRARLDAVGRVRTGWTFMLDADEALDAELAAALEAAEPGPGDDAYRVRRATYVCGRPLRRGAWGAEAPLRLFRTAAGRLEAHPAGGGEAELHEAWTVAGRVGRLAGTLHHHSYPTLAAYGRKFARYTSLEARGARPSYAALARAAARGALVVPWTLAVRGGALDGWRGAFVAVASAAYPAVVAWKALARARRP